MSIKSITAGEGLVAVRASKRLLFKMRQHMALQIMIPCKMNMAVVTGIGLLLSVGAIVGLEIEGAVKGFFAASPGTEKDARAVGRERVAPDGLHRRHMTYLKHSSRCPLNLGADKILQATS